MHDEKAVANNGKIGSQKTRLFPNRLFKFKRFMKARGMPQKSYQSLVTLWICLMIRLDLLTSPRLDYSSSRRGPDVMRNAYNPVYVINKPMSINKIPVGSGRLF